MLKIDRTDPKELKIEDDKVEYSQDEIHNLVSLIEAGNRQNYGSTKVISAFGIVGQLQIDKKNCYSH